MVLSEKSKKTFSTHFVSEVVYSSNQGGRDEEVAFDMIICLDGTDEMYQYGIQFFLSSKCYAITFTL